MDERRIQAKDGGTASSAHSAEEEPSESEDIVICGESSPQIVQTH